ncbi:14155_t:CDS:2 [Racocetra fulgida]|uniref:14155_t:CDS:1 n=1 Tax=Racocetra fulgida TaxID=60492 RepID=A0A9N9CFU2_9GLOM|nr:14155_t:CDS:2 [Racocetra fulgida]
MVINAYAEKRKAKENGDYTSSDVIETPGSNLNNLDGQCLNVGQTKFCVVQGIFNGLPGGLPGDECGGIIGTTTPANTTVGTCPSYDAIGNALLKSTTAPTFNNGCWTCTGSNGLTIIDLTQAIGGCTLQLLLPSKPV